MKIIFGFISIIICTFLGYKFSLKYSGKKKYYESFYNFNKLMQTEVRFKQATLKETLKNINENDDFYVILKDCFVSNIKFDELLKEKNKKIKYLTKDDVDYLQTYVNNLGTTDLDTQSRFLDVADKVLIEKNTKANKDENKYKTLCLKIGFLIGLMIFIIIL
ncbi:MAG: stage III sporulation protein AB [Clostridia bacterium]|nr:stage III sporulation protein AB [Clostridia bacterium]